MVRRQQGADRSMRPRLRSPGAPRFPRHLEAAFWAEIAKGPIPSEGAAVVGVSQPVGQRWFLKASCPCAQSSPSAPSAWFRAAVNPGGFIGERSPGPIHSTRRGDHSHHIRPAEDPQSAKLIIFAVAVSGGARSPHAVPDTGRAPNCHLGMGPGRDADVRGVKGC